MYSGEKYAYYYTFLLFVLLNVQVAGFFFSFFFFFFLISCSFILSNKERGWGKKEDKETLFNI